MAKKMSQRQTRLESIDVKLPEIKKGQEDLTRFVNDKISTAYMTSIPAFMKRDCFKSERITSYNAKIRQTFNLAFDQSPKKNNTKISSNKFSDDDDKRLSDTIKCAEFVKQQVLEKVFTNGIKQIGSTG